MKENQNLQFLLDEVNRRKKDLYYYHLSYAYYRTTCKHMESLTNDISMAQDGHKYQPYVMNKFMRELEEKLASTSPIYLHSLEQYDAFKKSFFLFSMAAHPGSITTAEKAQKLLEQIRYHFEELRRVEGNDKLEKVNRQISEEIPQAYAAVRMGVEPLLIISKTSNALLHFTDWINLTGTLFMWKVKDFVEVDMGPEIHNYTEAATYINDKMAPQTLA